MNLVISPRFPVELGSCQFTSPLYLEVVNAAERSQGLGTQTACSTRGSSRAHRAACLGTLPCCLGIPLIPVCVPCSPQALLHLQGWGWAVSPHPKGHSWGWALPAVARAGNDCPEPTERGGDQTSPEPAAPGRAGSLSCANTNLVQKLPTPALPSDYKCTRSF